MSRIALPQRISGAYVVVCGAYGGVTRQAQQRHVSRQALYRRAQRAPEGLEGASLRATPAEVRERLRALEAQAASRPKQLARSVVWTRDLPRQFAATGRRAA